MRPSVRIRPPRPSATTVRENHNGFTIDTSLERIDFDLVHSWLTSSYWSPGVSQERVERAARRSSLVIGAYNESRQLGYCRVISDETSFAWLCDVFVDEAHRGIGIAKEMVRFALAHPDYQGLRRWVLATRDAHDVYRACGFEPLVNPERWMIKL